MTEAAWRSAVLDHAERLAALLRRHVGPPDADDLLQELLADVIARGSPDARDVGAWLYGVAMNKVRMHLRSGRRRERHESRVPPPEPGDETPLSALLEAERGGRLRDALRRLPGADARLLRWKYIDDWNYDRIAARLGVSRHAVAHRLRDARRRLRDELGGEP